jgi:hypothetical protein
MESQTVEFYSVFYVVGENRPIFNGTKEEVKNKIKSLVADDHIIFHYTIKNKIVYSKKLSFSEFLP